MLSTVVDAQEYIVYMMKVAFACICITKLTSHWPQQGKYYTTSSFILLRIDCMILVERALHMFSIRLKSVDCVSQLIICIYLS